MVNRSFLGSPIRLRLS